MAATDTSSNMRILITNTQATVDDGAPIIHLFGRDMGGQRIHRKVVGMEPYFYAATPGGETPKSAFLGNNGITRIEGQEDHGYSPIKEPSQEIWKVYTQRPSQARSAAELFDKTWEADVRFTNRFRIDKKIFDWVEVPADSKQVPIENVEPVESPDETDPDPRVLTIDIEVDDRGGFPEPSEAPNRITCIVAHDSYEDTTIGFIDLDGRAVEEAFPDGRPEGVDELRFEPSEQRMLVQFFSYVSEVDPDVLTGWNFEDFDAPYLMNRAESIGAEVSRISPLGTAYYNDDYDEATIAGRTIYDLLSAYKDAQFSELRSYSLDYVAQQELDEAKLEFDSSFWDLYQNDPEKFVDYCARDVDLTRRINEGAGTLAFKDSLRKQVGVDFEETRNNYQYIEMMVRRRLDERCKAGPTKEESAYEDYGGGHVFDAYNGVAHNVMGIDVESLYPWTMYMLNSSPETKVSEAKAAVLEESGANVAAAPNGVHFKLPHDEDGDEDRGLFASLVKDALDLKEGYRDKKNEADPGSEEEDIFSTRYSVAKTITNCFTPDTEVMTPDGKRGIRDLEVGDEVYSFNPDTGTAEVKPVTKVWEYPDYDEELVNIQNSKVDFSVTPNHRMLVRQRDGYIQEDEYSFVEAGDLKSSAGYEMPHGWDYDGGDEIGQINLTEYMNFGEVAVQFNCHGKTAFNEISLPRDEAVYQDETGRYIVDLHDYRRHKDSIESRAESVYVHSSPYRKWVPAKYDGDDMIEFLGWFISEGCTNRNGNNYTIHIAQKDAGGALLDRMGFDYTESSSGLTFTSETLATILDRWCGTNSHEKKIPEFAFETSIEQQELLFETLVKGDGGSGEGRYRYTTASDELRDDVSRLLVHLGKNPQHSEDSGVHRIHYGSGNNSFRMHRDGETESTEDGVYCVSVADNHSLMAGRNGKFQFVGQSIYGVVGWEHFFLYDADVAEAVTTMGQSVIQETASYATSWDREELELIYGDTDSNYISFPEELTQEESVELCHQLCSDLEQEAYPALAEQHGMPAEGCEWRIDPEMYTPRFFMWGSKKYYSYRATWKEGMDYGQSIDKPKTKTKGSSSQRSDRAKITQELEKDIFESILDGKQEQVPDLVHDYATEITTGDPNWEYIGIPGGLSKPLDQYPENYAHAKAARNANSILGTNISDGDKPYRVVIQERYFEELGRRAKWLGFLSARDIQQSEHNIEPDRPAMLDKTIESPLGSIVNAIGYDVGECIRGNSAKQMTLEEMV